MDNVYKAYARHDEHGNVIKVFSDCFEKPEDGDTLIKEGFGDEFVHVQGQYGLYDEHGRHNYRGEMEEIPEDEKPPIPAPQPTQEEINAFLLLEVAKMKVGK